MGITETMEFPEDVLQIIRAYSRPCPVHRVVTRDHPEAKHRVILSYKGKFVSIASQGKTRRYDVGNRDPEQVWTVLTCWLQGMNPKQALHKFEHNCYTLTRIYSVSDLAYCAKNMKLKLVG